MDGPMCLNHSKTNGSSMFSLFLENWFWDDFWGRFGDVWDAFAVTFGPLGVILDPFGRSNFDAEKRWKKGHATHSGKSG